MSNWSYHEGEGRRPSQDFAGEVSPSDQLDPSNVIEKLKSFIEEGGYQPGEKLPPERDLAERLGVGRPALREGIKALCILDGLQSRRGDGTYVKSLDALTQGWPRRLEVPTSFNMLDLLELRKMIEPKAAALAAARASESDLRRIERERRRIEDAGENWERIGTYDFLLHTTIIEAAGNRVLTDVNRFLAPLLKKSREITAGNAPNRIRMLNDHRAIVEAIVKREAQVAEQAMLEHLHTVGLDLIADRKR